MFFGKVCIALSIAEMCGAYPADIDPAPYPDAKVEHYECYFHDVEFHRNPTLCN